MYDDQMGYLKDMGEMYWGYFDQISGGKGYITRDDLEAHRYMLE